MPSTLTPTSRFYPTLGSVITVSDLPDSLDFLKDKIEEKLNDIYFRDLQYSKSANGDAGFFSVGVILKERIDIEIPETGIFLVLNPDWSDTPDNDISVLPITVDYEWKILAYLRDFNLDDIDFDNAPQQIYEFALRVLNVSEERAVGNFINVFTEPIDDNTSKLEQFIDDINVYLDAGGFDTISVDLSSLTEVVEDIYDKTGNFGSMVAFGTYLLSDVDVQETKDNIKEYFRTMLPVDIEDYLLDLITPKVGASITLSAAIEFPRNILLPYSEADGEIVAEDPQDSGYPRFNFLFTPTRFNFHSDSGISYDLDAEISTNYDAQIGQTGIILSVDTVKLDLSHKTTIPEAKKQGRPDFKGAFINEASLTLPPSMGASDDPPTTLSFENLLIGNPGGVTGRVFLEEGSNLLLIFGETEILITSFEMIFETESIEGNIEATIKLPPDTQDTAQELDVTIGYSEDTGIGIYSLSVEPSLNPLALGAAEINVGTLQASFSRNGLENFSIDGTLEIPASTDNAGNPATLRFAAGYNEETEDVWLTTFTLQAEDSQDDLPALPGTAGDWEEAAAQPHYNGVVINFGQVIVEIASLSMDLNNGALENGFGQAYVRFPNATPPEGETGTFNEIAVGFEVDNGNYKFNANFDPQQEFVVGPATFFVNEFDLVINSGGFDSAQANVEIEVEGLNQSDPSNPSIPHRFNANIEYSEDKVSFAVDATGGIPIKIADTDIQIIEFVLSMDKSGFHEDTLIKGTVDINVDGEVTPVVVLISVLENGFELYLESEDEIDLTDPPIEAANIEADIKLKKFGIKKEAEDYEYTVGGTIVMDSDFPKVGDLIPSLIDLKEITIKTADENFYDLTIAWPGGASVSGNSDTGFSGLIPFNQLSDDPLISLDALELALTTEGNSLTLDAEFKNLILDLKVIKGKFGGMSLYVTAERNDTGDGNFGPLDLSAGFNQPMGIGISIGKEDSKVSGSGYLYIDPEAGRYHGYISISIETSSKSIGLDAIGVYTTKFPDGTEGNSFLALITVDFPKTIPLGLGFGLIGAGGIIGIHRNMNKDALVSGVKDGSIDNILFPEITLDTYEAILGDLESVFPIERDRHSFAIMGKINYAESNFFTMEVGFLISLPSPVVFGLAGVLHLRQPNDSGDKISINAAFLVVIDFGEQLVSINASLFHSKLGGITLEGDIAARFGWGDNKQFLFSAGGFHPTYTTDEFTLPSLKRMKMIIREDSKIKLTAESYVAITSNAFMFGGRIDFHYYKKKLSAEGFSGIDALFIFDPFRFRVDYYVNATISWKGKEVLSANVNALLEGPGEWRVKGYAKFKVCKIKAKVKFDKSFGDSTPDDIEYVNVSELLVEEFEKESNWRSTSPTDNSVTRREIPEDTGELVVSSNGQLRVDQMFAPLGLSIEVIGANRVTGPSEINITDAHIKSITDNNNELALTRVDKDDYFAPANFKKLTERQKLEAKAYELMPSGVDLNLDNSGWVISDHHTSREATFEEIVVETSGGSGSTGTFSLQSADLQRLSGGGAYGQSSKYRKNKRRKKNKRVKITDPEFYVVDTENLTGDPILFKTKSKTIAKEYAENLMTESPLLSKTIKAVADFDGVGQKAKALQSE